ncbi:hypothetical protein TNCV_3656281 [Trichonephila clavipes]|nr:hypothetical protein TNCV_3656281 [Trichonephila clavipes]
MCSSVHPFSRMLPQNSRTTVKVSFHDVAASKPCPDLTPYQLELRITWSTETTLIRKENMTDLMRCPVFVLLPLKTVLLKANFQRTVAFRTASNLAIFVKAFAQS